MIKLKRAYQPATGHDGTRFLVERLWPRGVRKTRLKLEGWLKDVAPSADLRKWFSHDPKKWPEFRRRYFTELRAHRAAWRPLLTDRKSTRLNSSHSQISYAVFCLKKKKMNDCTN